ncbi:MBL fold metallo-hydrolase [Halorubrum sp. FL23]|uniref:MBL fold metallo-hydrolase n=1 Tax=Halorubrum sp. FL23 TaxID=3458704 RepID=UPI00403417CF
MPIYDRCPASEYEVVDQWDGGIGWLAHPTETGRRMSHAVVGEDGGVWLIDPIDAPGIDEELPALGDVRGVIVCSNYHVRDADVFAARHDVPVYCPPWLPRATSQLDAPIEPETNTVGTSGFELRRCRPFPGWSEAVAYRGFDETLYVPDVLGTSPLFTVGEERLGMYLLCRFVPPRSVFEGLALQRILVGHGHGIFENASAALRTALDGARRRIPAALRSNGWRQIRALTAALGDRN